MTKVRVGQSRVWTGLRPGSLIRVAQGFSSGRRCLRGALRFSLSSLWLNEEETVGSWLRAALDLGGRAKPIRKSPARVVRSKTRRLLRRMGSVRPRKGGKGAEIWRLGPRISCRRRKEVTAAGSAISKLETQAVSPDTRKANTEATRDRCHRVAI